MHLRADVIHDPQTADTFDQLVFLQPMCGRDRMRTFTPRVTARTTRSMITASWYRSFCSHNVSLAPSMKCAKRFAAVVVAPDQVFRRAGVEWRPFQSASKHSATSATSCLCFVTTA